MRIHTRLEYGWNEALECYVLLREAGYEFEGAVALLKGADPAQQDLAAQQASFYQTMTQDYQTQFGKQGAILDSLTNSLTPILNAGPNQPGFSDAETNNLNSQAVQGTATAYNNAQKSAQEAQAGQGGGNVPLPSGVVANQRQQLASAGANQESGELLGIQSANYKQGHDAFQNAVGQLQGVAGEYNPTGYAGAATSAGSAAASEANAIAKENSSGGIGSTLGGILGGVAGSFAGPLGTAVGSSIGSSIGKSASGAPPNSSGDDYSGDD